MLILIGGLLVIVSFPFLFFKEGSKEVTISWLLMMVGMLLQFIGHCIQGSIIYAILCLTIAICDAVFFNYSLRQLLKKNSTISDKRLKFINELKDYCMANK